MYFNFGEGGTKKENKWQKTQSICRVSSGEPQSQKVSPPPPAASPPPPAASPPPPPSLERGPCKEDDDHDHGGADITNFQNIPSSGACCDKCIANKDCKSWTWGKIDGKWSKTCWIKNKQFGSSGKRTYKPGLISGQPPPRPPPRLRLPLDRITPRESGTHRSLGELR